MTDVFRENDHFINCVLLAGAYFLQRQAAAADKRLRLCSMGFSAFISLVFIIGYPIYTYDRFGDFLTPSRFIINLISFAGFTAVIHSVLTLCIQSLLPLETFFSKSLWKIWKYPAVFGLLFFLCWLPVYLAFYPGIFAYDIEMQTSQIMGLEPFTRYHPPLHNWYWQLCLWLEETLSLHALVCYSLSQMALLAGALTYVLYFMIKRQTGNLLLTATALFFAFNPCIALFSFNPTKDVLFAALLAMYVIELYSFIAEKEHYSQSIACNIRLVVTGILCCLFRNNMVYALLPATVIMAFLLKAYWKRILLWGLCIFAGYALINGPLYTALGVGPGNARESLSIPIQQISTVVVQHKAKLTSQDLEDISLYLPLDIIEANYNPRITDRVKVHFHTDYYEQDSSTFFEVWLRLLRQYPLVYVEAFLNLNIPLWYPDAATVDPHTYETYIATYISQTPSCGYQPVRESKIPWLENKYQVLASFEFFGNHPVLAKCFSINTPVWLLLFTATVLWIKKRKALIAPLVPVFLLWCTYLLGPVSIFRYVFPIMVLYPLLSVLILQSGSMEPETTG